MGDMKEGKGHKPGRYSAPFVFSFVFFSSFMAMPPVVEQQQYARGNGLSGTKGTCLSRPEIDRS